VITSYALPMPGRAFRVEHNGRAVLDLPPAHSSRDRVLQILGDSAGPHLAVIEAAIDEGVPTNVLSAALYGRFTSRGESGFANQVLSAMRQEFGGHVEKAADKAGTK